MGYTTEFTGEFKLNKPLTVKQLRELEALADEGDGCVAAPKSYCQWVPTHDGEGIKWDGAEKFDLYAEWLAYLAECYLKPWGLLLNGEVQWQGEDPDDIGTLIAVNNAVTAKKRVREEPGDRRNRILREAVGRIHLAAICELGRIGPDHVNRGVLVGIRDLVDTALIDLNAIDKEAT